MTISPGLLLPLSQSRSAELRVKLGKPRLERAIGVIYRPDSELASHYFEVVLPRQFDEYFWIDRTSAVKPFDVAELQGLPDTYPFGVWADQEPLRGFMEFKDYYKILGLERSATQDEIKKAYRKLARTYHPDINKDRGAEARFKEISEANEVLADAEKRAAYDQLGRQWQSGQEFQPPPNWDAGFEFSGATSQRAEGEFSDFFETLFSRMRRGEQPSSSRAEFHARGEDHHAKILIDLRDSLEGATRTLSLSMPAVDADGHVVIKDHTLNVTIPKGVTEGQSVRLKGQGAPGIGRLPAGDLYLEIQFNPDPLYRVVGNDLYVELPVAPWEAALGATVKFPTPAGPIMLKIPAGSSQGRELRIKGRGIPAAKPGDLYAVLKIVLPPADTEKARQAYADMARELAFDPRSKLGV